MEEAWFEPLFSFVDDRAGHEVILGDFPATFRAAGARPGRLRGDDSFPYAPSPMPVKMAATRACRPHFIAPHGEAGTPHQVTDGPQ